MKKIFVFFVLCLFSRSLLLGVEEESQQHQDIKLETKEPAVEKISEALGHMIGKNLLEMGIHLDIASVVKGLQDSSNGKTSPLSESECVKAISSAQEANFKKLAQTNLAQAEAFLNKKEKENNIVSLEKGKLQYTIEKEGAGALVEAHSTPLVSCVGKFLDGSVFSNPPEELTLSLDDAIPGLKTGIAGMKEGEKRTLYVHPELGYGTAGMLPPNSLLTFEIEVKKAHVSPHPATPQISTQGADTPADSTKELSDEKEKVSGDLR